MAYKFNPRDFKIPTFAEVEEKIGDKTDLELFIYNEEPAGDDAIRWREGLQNLVTEIIIEFTHEKGE